MADKPTPKKRGGQRKPKEQRKRAVTLRLDPDLLAHFRATGPGWQTRINATLREVMNLDEPEKK